MFSDRDVFRRQANVVRYSATHWSSSTALVLVSSFFNFAAGSKLCAAKVVHGDEEDAVVGIPAWDQAMLKSTQHQAIRRTVREDVAEQTGLCEGRRKSFEISSLCPFSPFISKLLMKLHKILSSL